MLSILIYLLIAAVFLGVCYLLYSFLGVFIQEKKRKVIITVILAVLSLSIYLYEDNRHVIYMKEDVMYVHPAKDTIRSNFK
jgi:hypothetical protein